MVRVRTALPLMLLLTVSLAQGATIPPPPDFVAIVIDAEEATITWTPSTAASRGAVTYKVYGVSGGTVLLGVTDGLSFTAPDGFSTFGVSSVVNGVEGDMKRACIFVEDKPPNAGVDFSCGPRLPLPDVNPPP